MPDARFYESAEPLTLAELADLCRADLARGDPSARIETVAPLAQAGERGVAFLGDPKYRPELAATRAGAVLVAAAHADLVPQGSAVLISREPQAAWSRAAQHLHRARLPGLEAISGTARLDGDVQLGPGVVIGPGAAIGAGTRIGANTVIGPGAQIGRDCDIAANVSLGFCLIGDRVRIGPGSVIGEAGFGVTGSREGLVAMAQLGRVILQDGVGVGANTCIDRGAYDDTVVGENTKIDNLVQVGHNSVIGRNCVLAGHVGISGSVVIGDGAALGGRAGVTDHVRVGAGCKIAAASMVMNDVPDGEVWGGQPARPLKRFLRETLWVAKQARGRDGDRHG